MSNDTIGDTLTRIRNANSLGSQKTNIPYTKISYQILDILKSEGFIDAFEKTSTSTLVVYLKYKSQDRRPIITNLRRISRPGRRVYVNYKDVPSLLGGLGVVLISTSKGIITDKDARASHIGGEVLCAIW